MSDVYSAAQAASELKALAIRPGDVMFVHSALKRLGRLQAEGDMLEALLQVFQSAVGDQGMIVVPTFNFGFCKGAPFDVRSTPSEGMGAFSEFVRRHPKSYRSQHPFQSIAAIGPKAKELAKAEGRSGFSTGSAFDVLLKLRCKILFFGTGFIETFAHIAEERANVPYRFWKTFTGDVTDADGKRSVKSFDFFARDLERRPEPLPDNDRIGRHLLKKGIIKEAPLGAGRIGVADANEVVEELVARLQDEPEFLLVG